MSFNDPLDAADVGNTAKSWLDAAQQMKAGLGGSCATSGAGEDTKAAGSEQAAGGAAKEHATLIEKLQSEVARAVLPEWEMPSVMRKRTDVNAREIQVGGGPTDLVVKVRPQNPTSCCSNGVCGLRFWCASYAVVLVRIVC
jgi:hypothetical protein